MAESSDWEEEEIYLHFEAMSHVFIAFSIYFLLYIHSIFLCEVKLHCQQKRLYIPIDRLMKGLCLIYL